MWGSSFEILLGPFYRMAHQHTSASVIPPTFDLSIFNDINNTQTNEKCQYKDMEAFSKCESLNRLFVSLRYCSLLQIHQNKNHRHIFDHFINNIYKIKHLLNDYTHFINNHSEYIQEIADYLIKEKSFKICKDIKHCQYSQRHHRADEQTQVTQMSDSHLNLYAETLDSIHFYIFHLYQVGLRSSKDDNDSHIKTDEKCDDEYFDESFYRIRNLISSTRNKTKSFERFPNLENNNDNGNISKFNIKVNNNVNFTNDTSNISDGKAATYLDTIYKHLIASKIDPTTMNELMNYIQTEDYCTEAVNYDLNHNNDLSMNSNISNMTNNPKCIQCIIDFMSEARRMFCLFSSITMLTCEIFRNISII